MVAPQDEGREEDPRDAADAPGHGFPVEGDPFPDEPIGLPADQRRELTALEMMDAPARPNERTRKTVIWVALAFASVMFSLTLGVIAVSGLDILEVFTLLMLGGVIYGLFGALRHKGEDPMAQFDPPPIPKRRVGRRTRRKARDDDSG